MSEFNKGDHVRYTGASGGYVDRGKLGWTGYVVDAGELYCYINWGDSQNEVSNANLALVEELPAAPAPVAEPEAVEHPQHYGGDAPYEVIKVAEAWDFDKDAYLFNVLKYIARHETKGKPLEDLRKALWYLERKINRLEEASA